MIASQGLYDFPLALSAGKTLKDVFNILFIDTDAAIGYVDL